MDGDSEAVNCTQASMDKGKNLSLIAREVPLYGLEECHVHLEDDASHSMEEDHYVVIQGSRLTHVTTAKMGGDSQTLNFVVPGHDAPETVFITPYCCCCSKSHFKPCGAQSSFQYVQDIAQDVAEYLNTKQHQLGPHSYLDIKKIFLEWIQAEGEVSGLSNKTNLQEHTFSDTLRLLDERITQAMANCLYPPQWTETNPQIWKCNETADDPQLNEALLQILIDLGLNRLSHFVIHQFKGQSSLTRPGQDRDSPQSPPPNEDHGISTAITGSADPVAGVSCVWSDSSSMLRFCPGANSLTLTVQHTLGSSSHQDMLLTLREHLRDQATLKLVSEFKGCGEAHLNVKEHSVHKDLKKEESVDKSQANTGFEEHLIPSLDGHSFEMCQSSSSDCTSSLKDPTLALNEMHSEFNSKFAEDVTFATRLNISGVTRDSTKTDSTLWDTEDIKSTSEATDTLPSYSNLKLCQSSASLDGSFSALPVGQSDGSSTDQFDLSPSLIALELNSEEDGSEVMSPVSPFIPDVDRNDEKQDDFSPFPTRSCTRSLSASLSEHTSKEPKQDTRLRSYSYSSSKRFRRGQSVRDVSPDPMDTISYGRSLLQALSLSKSLSLLHPSKQKPSCMPEQSHEKREISFHKRAQSADDEGSFVLVQSLQHLTLSEFLKEIEEEELDTYDTPLKVESEKHKVIRTFSFLKNRMSTTRNRSKSKKERESKDRQLHGHQFSTGSCLGPTMCVVCDKPATGKDLLHCSVCTAIVHKSCKDSIPPCLKNKYALPLVRNKTASLPQNFTVRESAPQYILPAPSATTAVSHKDKKDSGPLPFTLSRSAERLNEFSETESDQSKATGPSEDPLTSPVYSPSAGSSSGEDCVDTYIFKDILADAADYEAESWSSTVDHKFCRKQDKKSVKRQDVIYELMQTEIHHLQTLHVMAEVFRRGVREEVQLEADAVERLFPCLDQLLLFHHSFFAALKERRQNSQSLEQNNYLIQRIGDVLLHQFSDVNGERMTYLYGEFCSHHNEAVSFFKELQLNNKKFHNFVKQQGNNYLVRRREIPECILLVTQRITKYPVLLERILHYTQTGSEEHRDLTKALALIRELIAAVNQQVSKYELQQKLQEVWTRMENRSSVKLKNGRTFRKQDIMRPGQTLAHEGVLFWKSATGRLKDVLALLLMDTLIFLQEKDQKFVFAAVDQKPPVIALQKLIVREVANEERGMFLISASSAGPEMYEVHTCSKDERNTWMRLIREAVESCPEGEQDYISESEEDKRAGEIRLQKIHRYQESLSSHDQQICSSLEEKLQIYAELSTISGATDNSRIEPKLLVQRHPEDMPQAALLLSAALQEAEILQTILLPKMCSPPGGSLESEVTSAFSCSPFSNVEASSDITSVADPESSEECLTRDSAFHSLTEMQKKDMDSKVSQSVQSLTQLLYSLQAAVTLQDSWYEVKRLLLLESGRPSPRPKCRQHFSSQRANTLQVQEKQRNLEKQKEELATAQKLQDQLRQDRERWEQECLARESQQEAQEMQLQERETQCLLKTERLKQERAELDAQLEEYQQSLERLREGQRSVEKEREQLEIQQKRLQIWKHSQQRGTNISHMVIPLDVCQSTAVTQPADHDDNGFVFVNEANCSPHSLHQRNDPSTRNCLNALLARSNSRRRPNVSAHPESEGQRWVMSSEHFESPARGLRKEHLLTDLNREGFVQDAWLSTADFVRPHHGEPEELMSADADRSREEPKEETVVYL